LDHKLGIAIRRASETVSAVRLGRAAARPLAGRPGAPAFRADRVSFGPSGDALAFDRGFIPGDRIARELRSAPAGDLELERTDSPSRPEEPSR